MIEYVTASGAIKKDNCNAINIFAPRNKQNALENVSDILLEVMSFLYPPDWGKLAQSSTSMANAVIPIRWEN